MAMAPEGRKDLFGADISRGLEINCCHDGSMAPGRCALEQQLGTHGCAHKQKVEAVGTLSLPTVTGFLP